MMNSEHGTDNKSTHYYNKQLLRTGAFADCTITCKGRSWPAHRNILSPRCDFFKCCFDGRFSEGWTRVIAMQDDDPVAVQGMLYFLYTLDYPKEAYKKLLGGETDSGSDSGIEEDEESTDGQNVQVYWGFDLLIYTIADKYGLLQLRRMAERSLLDKADAALKDEQQFFKTADGLVPLVEELFATEEISQDLKVLRRQIVSLTSEVVAGHIRDARVSALIADVPEFAIELVEALGRKRIESRTVQKGEEKRQEAEKIRLTYIPMNEESDDED